MKPKVMELHERDENAVIYICGHSKGGAMATLMAKIIEKDIPGAKVQVHTFGSPRVGDEVFRKEYHSEHCRYESFLDLVPHLCFTKEEKDLFPRLSSVYEQFTPFLKLPDNYVSVGKRICFDVKEKTYGRLPVETENKNGETLNSLCAVEEIIRAGDFKLLIDNIHNGSYFKYIEQHGL